MQIEGFSVFVGIVAGTIVQLATFYFVQWRNKRNAAKLLRSEISYNLGIISEFRESIVRIKDLAAVHSLGPHDHYINMRLFAYNIVTSLANQGWMPHIIDEGDLKKVYYFGNMFNQQSADFWYSQINANRKAGNFGEIVRLAQTALDICDRSRADMEQVRQKTSGWLRLPRPWKG